MNKALPFFVILITAVFFFSCEQDHDPSSLPLDEFVIQQITEAENIELVGRSALPVDILSYVDSHHSPFEVDMAFRAPQLGFEIILENGFCLFFDMNGQPLGHDGMHNDWDNHHGWNGPGSSYCLFGDELGPGSLPQAALDYIAENHSGTTITTVVAKPSGKLAVELSDGTVLMFGPGGEFMNFCGSQPAGGQHGHDHGLAAWQCDSQGHGQGHGGHHGHMDNPPNQNGPCWGGTGTPLEELPEAIVAYLNGHYPDAELIHALQTYSGNYFLRLSNCVRLVFDEEGNLIFDSQG